MQKGFVSIPVIIIFLVGTAVIGGGSYYVTKEISENKQQSSVETEQSEERQIDTLVSDTSTTNATTTESIDNDYSENDVQEDTPTTVNSIQNNDRQTVDLEVEAMRQQQAEREAVARRLAEEKLELERIESERKQAEEALQKQREQEEQEALAKKMAEEQAEKISVDEYGFTEEDWVVFGEKWIASSNDLKSSTRSQKKVLEEYSDSVDQIIKRVLEDLSKNVLDSNGTKLAEKHLEASQALKTAYVKEISLRDKFIDTLEEKINAIEDKDLKTVDQKDLSLESLAGDMAVASNQTAVLVPSQAEAADAYFYYVQQMTQ